MVRIQYQEGLLGGMMAGLGKSGNEWNSEGPPYMSCLPVHFAPAFECGSNVAAAAGRCGRVTQLN